MPELFLEPSDNLLTALKKIKEAPFEEIELVLPPESPLLDNLLNLKILKKEARKAGKRLKIKSYSGGEMEDLAGGTAGEVVPDKATFGFVRGKDIAEAALAKGYGRSLKVKLGRNFLIPLGAIGFLVALLVLGYLYVPKATVNLSVDSEALVKSFEIEASPSAQSINEEQRVIPAVKITATGQEESEGEATGKKEVGEKAKGVVTLYNKTNSEKSFPAGTVISKGRVEGEDLRFLLENGLTVPARTSTTSAEQVTTYFPGRVEVSVTAEKIGEEYNLSRGETFNVANYPTNDFIAQCYADFAGGTKRKVSVVSIKDREKLEEELKSKLESRLRNDLESRLVGDQKLEKGAVSFKELKKDFDKEVGEEADKFNLKMEFSALGFAYSQGQLKDLLGKLLKEFVPEQYELSSAEGGVEVFGAKTEKEVLEFTAKVQGFVIPKIDKESLRNELAGKPLDWGCSYISSIANIRDCSINLWPPFPRFLRSLPHRRERIEMEVLRR